MTNPLQFTPQPITGTHIAAAALEYKGLRYNLASTCIARSPTGLIDGYTNCYGLLLQVAKDLALLPVEFDVNLPPQLYGKSQAKTLVDILNLNFDKVSEPEIGDIVLMAYKDENPRFNEPHHVGVITGHSGLEYKMLHAVHSIGATDGGVIEQRMDALMKTRVDGVWRIKSYD